MNFLKERLCFEMQGYYYLRPVGAAKIKELLVLQAASNKE
jgi:EAL domain-containing protein (putative c-di-GMP-specific phosphodiesterase class I)